MLTRDGTTNPLTTISAKPAEDEAFVIRFTEKLGTLLPLFQPGMRDAEEFWFPDKALIHKAEANGIWPEVEAALGLLFEDSAAAYRSDP